MEAHGGGFAPTARRVCAYVAKVGAARENEEIDFQAAKLLRRISIAVHRENARAIIRRLPSGLSTGAVADPAAWVEPCV